ncbi:hypothetical protein BH11ACT6_BH11ACT6_03630 [soil metagenome]
MHHIPVDATTAADDTWADPAWQIDSATRTCCHGIGDHTADCQIEPPPPVDEAEHGALLSRSREGDRSPQTAVNLRCGPSTKGLQVTNSPTKFRRDDAVSFDDEHVAESYLRETRYAHITPPDAAETVSEWFDDDGFAVRILTRDAATWTFGQFESVSIRAYALQHSDDGSVTPWSVEVRATDGVEMSSVDARAVATAILAAAESSDLLSEVAEDVLNIDAAVAAARVQGRKQHVARRASRA